MKTNPSPTNFTSNATHIAEYGYQLAKQLKANVIFCNTESIPGEAAEAGIVVWPVEEGYGLSDGYQEELELLKAHLNQLNPDGEFRPGVTFVNQSGITKFIVNTIARTQNIDFVLISKPGSNGLSTFFLGNNGKNMIKSLVKARILVPPVARTAPIRKIAFAIDLKNTESDLEAVDKLIPFAKELNAEILITHIHTKNDTSPNFDGYMAHFLTKVSNDLTCPNIFYRTTTFDSLEKGLNWLCEYGKVDMLAMHTLQDSFFHSLSNKSYNDKMVNPLPVPLLVFAD